MCVFVCVLVCMYIRYLINRCSLYSLNIFVHVKGKIAVYNNNLTFFNLFIKLNI